MYKIGDYVVYPMHGAGIIEGIEEKEIMGETKQYYILKMPIGNICVMIPVANVDEIGVRDVIDAPEADRVLCEFKSVEPEDSTNWNKRYRDNMAKIKSGNALEVAYVVKSLMVRDKIRGLATGERKMLSNAKQILMSEIVLAKKDMDQERLEELMNQIVDEQVSVE